METKETKKEEAVKTVKVRVTEAFRNKFDIAELYVIGQELEFEEARAADVVERKLAEYAEPLG